MAGANTISNYPPDVEFYQDQYDRWRWRIKSEKGTLLGASTQGYQKKHHAKHNYCSLGLSIVESRAFDKFFEKLHKNTTDEENE